ncbi:unnamed protein product [Closterium sp. NIES-53]
MEDGPSKIRRICVYCGSSSGTNPVYGEAAADLGREIAGRGFDLVYGSGSIGLMGIVARTVHENGRHVLGVIPHALVPREVSGPSVGEVRLVRNMHERKAEMAKAADAFIALPGGYGTLEELLEMVTWSQLGIHDKPIAVLNANGYFDSLLAFFDRAAQEGFVNATNRSIVMAGRTAKEVLDLIEAFDADSRGALLAKERWHGEEGSGSGRDGVTKEEMVKAVVEP